MLLQLRKHNIAKNYSKENQEMQIKSSRIVNMIKHFSSSPKTSFCILWIFQMPLTPSKEKGAWKNEEKIRCQLWLTQARGPIQKTVFRQFRQPLRYQEKQELVCSCYNQMLEILKKRQWERNPYYDKHLAGWIWFRNSYFSLCPITPM